METKYTLIPRTDESIDNTVLEIISYDSGTDAEGNNYYIAKKDTVLFSEYVEKLQNSIDYLQKQLNEIPSQISSLETQLSNINSLK